MDRKEIRNGLRPVKKPFETPKIVELGTLQEIVKGANSSPYPGDPSPSGLHSSVSAMS